MISRSAVRSSVLARGHALQSTIDAKAFGLCGALLALVAIVLPTLSQAHAQANTQVTTQALVQTSPSQPSGEIDGEHSDGVSSTSKAVPIEGITVKGQAITGSARQPFSVKTFDQEDFRERQVRNVEQLFREVAGMEIRGLGYGNVANSMTLRSFSGGGHGGDIGFVIDGLPLNEASSHADGYTDLAVVVPLEVASLRVFKGPVSALYGNFNRAGLVAIETRKGGPYSEVDFGVGSYGTADLQAALGTQLGGVNVNLAVQAYRTDGYRPQSDSQRGTFAGRVAFDVAPDTRLSIATRLFNGQSNTASIITQSQYDNRTMFFRLDPRVQNDSTDKVFKTLRADLSHQLSANLKVLAFLYGTQQTFRRSFTRPTNATTWQQRNESYARDVQGYGVSLNGEHQISAPLRWVVGAERYQEKSLYTYADALNNGAFTANTMTAGIAGGLGTLNRNLRNDFSSAFVQVEWQLDRLFTPAVGVRYDGITGRCDVAGLETRTGASAQCNQQPRFNITTPKFGIQSNWIRDVFKTRISVAEGFSLPSDAAKFTAGLSVNPTKFRQTELGATFKPHASVEMEIATFRIDSRDEVALTVPTILLYSNIGKTRRQGVEAELRYSPTTWLEFSAALASFRTKVTESLPSTPFLVGSELTGVARELVTTVTTVRPIPELVLTATGRSVGRYAISPPSATVTPLFYGGYKTIDLMASYQLTTAAGMKRRFYAQIANATDRRYATSAGVTSGLRTYNPAPPRAFMVGLAADF